MLPQDSLVDSDLSHMVIGFLPYSPRDGTARAHPPFYFGEHFFSNELVGCHHISLSLTNIPLEVNSVKVFLFWASDIHVIFSLYGKNLIGCFFSQIPDFGNWGAIRHGRARVKGS
jgi:hypothetical protein